MQITRQTLRSSFFAFLAFAAITALAPVVAIMATRPAHADDIDDYIAGQREKQKIAGLSLAVAQDGLVVKAQGYGLASIELGVPATAANVYEIGSISKTFTATLVLMLVDAGKVSFDAPIARYIDGTPATWAKITVRELLNQTSGIRSYTSIPTFASDDARPVTGAALVKYVSPFPLAFAPGTQFAYSNTNYFLLALIAEKAGGAPYATLLHDKIFAPLGMGATRTVDPNAIIPNRAQGYDHAGDGTRQNAVLGDASWLMGAGSIVSTVGDLAKWDRAQDSDALLKPATRTLRQTPPTLAKGSAPSTYGFGWVIDTVHGHREIWHNGGISGFRCQMVRFPDDKLTVIVLTNSGDASPELIARGIAGFYIPGLSSATEKAIPDADPALTATVRKIFADIAKGTGDPTLYTPEMWRLMQSGLQHDAGYQALGDVQNVELLETHDHPAEGFHTYRYRLTYPNSVMIIQMSRDANGKISGMSIKPD